MGKTVYVHVNTRKPEGEAYAYYATLLYKDPKGKLLLYSDICRLENQSDNTHHRALQCYANGLDLIYNHQAQLMEEGVTNVLLVLSEKTLGQWLKDKAPIKYRKAIDKLHRMYAFGGTHEIRLDVGIANDTVKNKAYRFCNKEYITRKRQEIQYESITV